MSEAVELKIAPITAESRALAVGLLSRFFREEGFVTPHDRIAHNLSTLLSETACWGALATDRDGRPVGVITVTTMLYVEWGRLGEIGDLYVVPEFRRRGVARDLITQALAWCREKGCSGVFVTITPEGEARHGLSGFYARLAFQPTGRTSMALEFRGMDA